MKIHDLSHAISTLRPNTRWYMTGDMTKYTNLVWQSAPKDCPTEHELLVEVERLDAEFIATQYRTKRKKEYPPLTDLADALYWQSMGDSTKLDEYNAKIAEIKALYPKPT